MENEIFEIYKRNFPFTVRGEDKVRAIFRDNENTVIGKRDKDGKLIGVAVVNRNTILMLCVDREYRNRGLGSELLTSCEETVREKGYQEVILGAGFDYVMPGVPTPVPFFPSESERTVPNGSEAACRFFMKRGYRHTWDCNCFDMKRDLTKAVAQASAVKPLEEGIVIRWARDADREAVMAAVADAHASFMRHYGEPCLYREDSKKRAMVACRSNRVVGAVIVGLNTEGEAVGSIGCTAVCHEMRGKHIAAAMIGEATAYLQKAGMREAFVGYTYSGLEKLYGYGGYAISGYYMMAKKQL